jgi:hypothetical protein
MSELKRVLEIVEEMAQSIHAEWCGGSRCNPTSKCDIAAEAVVILSKIIDEGERLLTAKKVTG